MNSETTVQVPCVSQHISNEMLAAACLPAHIQEAIKVVLQRHPEYKTKSGALGNCVIASDELLFYIDQKLGSVCDGYVDGVTDYKGHGFHNWAVVEGFCIDLTARQFDEKELCPKIWLCPKGSS